MRAAVITAAIAAGCSGGGPSPARSPAPPEAPPPPIDAAPAPDAPPPLGESEARSILFERFRRAGFRILQDVRPPAAGGGVTLDGFDPQAGVGYEYVAPEERGKVFSEGERDALERAEGIEILILDPTGSEEIEERAAAFLERVSGR